MSINRVKEWITGEILTASQLNAEFDNITGDSSGAQLLASPRVAAFDMAGQRLILDANSNTSITADTDDQIDFELGGSDLFRMTTTGFDGVGTDKIKMDGVFVARRIAQLRGALPRFNTVEARVVSQENDAVTVSAMMI